MTAYLYAATAGLDQYHVCTVCVSGRMYCGHVRMPTCVGCTRAHKKLKVVTASTAAKSVLTTCHVLNRWETWTGSVVTTATVNSPTFKRTLRIIYLVREANGKTATARLFSTDTDCSALNHPALLQSAFPVCRTRWWRVWLFYQSESPMFFQMLMVG